MPEMWNSATARAALHVTQVEMVECASEQTVLEITMVRGGVSLLSAVIDKNQNSYYIAITMEW